MVRPHPHYEKFCVRAYLVNFCFLLHPLRPRVKF